MFGEEAGDENVIEFTMSNGSKHQIVLKNGAPGEKGEQGERGEKGD